MSRAPTFAEIGGRIRVLREGRGLSQADLALVLGVSRPVVTKIEKGGKAINSVEVRKLADFLGVSVDELTRAVEEESLVARFREQKQDPKFLESVLAIEEMVRDMVAQVALKEKRDAQR